MIFIIWCIVVNGREFIMKNILLILLAASIFSVDARVWQSKNRYNTNHILWETDSTSEGSVEECREYVECMRHNMRSLHPR